MQQVHSRSRTARPGGLLLVVSLAARATNASLPQDGATTLTALSANVTSINFTGDKGFIRAYPSGLSDRPLTNANAVAPGRIRGVFNIINVGGPDPGRFKLLSDMPIANIDAIVDVSGYFAPFGSAPTGNSWYLTLRDSDHRLMTEFRWDQTANRTTLLTDHVYLGSTRVATLGTTQTPSVPSGLTFYSTDHLGSARLAHGEGGTVLGVYRYRSFGQPFTGTSTPQGVDFAAMERDTSSGDHYDHARFYSGYTGRFNIPDKLGAKPEDPGSFNRYAYARNNPLKFVDADGKQAIGFMAAVANGEPNAVHAAQWTNTYIAGMAAAAAVGAGALAAAPEMVVLAPALAAVAGDASLALAVAHPTTTSLGLGLAGAGVGYFSGASPPSAAAIRFTQDSVAATFRNGQFAGKTIDAVAAGLRSGQISPAAVPVGVIVREGVTYAVNNRSLTAVLKAGVQPVIKDLTGDPLLEKQLTDRLAKLAKKGIEMVEEIRVR